MKTNNTSGRKEYSSPSVKVLGDIRQITKGARPSPHRDTSVNPPHSSRTGG